MADVASAESILQLLDRFTDAMNRHDIDAVMALCTEDIVFESTDPAPDGVRHEGREAVRSAWGQMVASTPAARFAVEEQFACGDGRAVVRWRYDWGDGHVRGVDVLRVRDGRIAETLAYVKG
jgi:ketosteroid isomerase-like protein